MEIEDWDPEKHLELVRRWSGQPCEASNFPPDGWLVDGIAAGFLYLTKCDVAFLDSVVTDPSAPFLARGKAVLALLERIRHRCVEAGVRHLVSHTDYSGLAEVGRVYGFQVTDGWLLRGRI